MNNIIDKGIKRLSSTGVARLSTIDAIAVSAMPIQPTNRQAGREKTKKASDPSHVLRLLWGRW
jgi:hypothetical protein